MMNSIFHPRFLTILIGLLALTVPTSASWDSNLDVVTDGTTTESPGVSTGSDATAEAAGGEVLVDVVCYPSESPSESDQAEADASMTTWKKSFSWEDYTQPNLQEFEGHVEIDLEWDVGGNSNNGWPTAATTSAAAEIYVLPGPGSSEHAVAHERRCAGADKEPCSEQLAPGSKIRF